MIRRVKVNDNALRATGATPPADRAPESRDAPSPAGTPADRRIAWLDSMRPFRARRERDVSMETALQAIERELRQQQDAVGDVIDVWNRLAPAGVRNLAAIVGVSAGTLTLAVTSSGASYELSRALRDGLERQLVHQMPSRVKRIKVRIVSE